LFCLFVLVELVCLSVCEQGGEESLNRKLCEAVYACDPVNVGVCVRVCLCVCVM